MCSIAIGALVAGSIPLYSKLFLACFSGGFITGAANTINDFFDGDIDRINKPDRPLPAGLVSPQNARIWSFLLFGLGIGLSLLINPLAVLIASATSLLLFYYSYRLKRTILSGNLVVGLVSALAFIYGGVAVEQIGMAFIPAVFAFFFHLGREILKDIEDVPGDRKNQIKTFPITYGINPSRWLISAIFLLLIPVTFIPFILGIFGKVYLIVVVFGVDLFLLFVIFSLWRDSSTQNLHRLSDMLKVDMVVGLAAILCGVMIN